MWDLGIILHKALTGNYPVINYGTKSYKEHPFMKNEQDEFLW